MHIFLLYEVHPSVWIDLLWYEPVFVIFLLVYPSLISIILSIPQPVFISIYLSIYPTYNLCSHLLFVKFLLEIFNLDHHVLLLSLNTRYR